MEQTSLPTLSIVGHLADPQVTVRLLRATREPVASLPGFAPLAQFFRYEGLYTVFDLVCAHDELLKRVVVMDMSADTFIDAALSAQGLRRYQIDPEFMSYFLWLARRPRLPIVAEHLLRSADH